MDGMGYDTPAPKTLVDQPAGNLFVESFWEALAEKM